MRKRKSQITLICLSLMVLLLSNAIFAESLWIQPNYQGTRAHSENAWYVVDGDNIQQHVVNHTGNSGIDSLEFNESVNLSLGIDNFTDQFIAYGQEGSENEAFAFRQFALETEVPGLFDVITNIRGNAQILSQPVDIVLVADHSSSMAPGSHNNNTNRLSFLDQAIENFSQYLHEYVQALEEEGMGLIRIGHIAFGSTIIEGSTIPLDDIYNTSHLNRLRDITPSSTPTNYTFTQLGVREGAKLFNNSNNKQIMVLLTDGVPTYSNAITQYNDINNNGIIDIGEVLATTTQASGRIVGNSTLTNPLSNNQSRYIDMSNTNLNSSLTIRHVVGSSDGAVYNSTFPATIFEIEQTIQNNPGLIVEVVGLGLSDVGGGTFTSGPTRIDLPGISVKQIQENFEFVVSRDHFFNIPDSELGFIQQRLLEPVREDFLTVPHGLFVNEVGQQFILETNSIKASFYEEVDGNIVLKHSVPSGYINITNNGFSISNITLGLDEHIQIRHQVRLNTEDALFVPDAWYFISNPEKTSFKPDVTSLSYPIAVPSGRGPGTKIELSKIWDDINDASNIRPEQVTFVVGRNATSGWNKANAVMSGVGNTWHQSFNQLQLNNQEIYLPKYNNQGDLFEYVLLEEKDVFGYTSVIDGNTITNIKNVLFELVKIDAQTKEPIPGVSFTLESKSTNQVVTGISNEDGLIVWDNDAFRFEPSDIYILSEEPLPGYHKAGPWLIEVTDNHVVSIVSNDYLDNIVEYRYEDRVFHLTLSNLRQEHIILRIRNIDADFLQPLANTRYLFTNVEPVLNGIMPFDLEAFILNIDESNNEFALEVVSYEDGYLRRLIPVDGSYEKVLDWESSYYLKQLDNVDGFGIHNHIWKIATPAYEDFERHVHHLNQEDSDNVIVGFINHINRVSSLAQNLGIQGLVIGEQVRELDPDKDNFIVFRNDYQAPNKTEVEFTIYHEIEHILSLEKVDGHSKEAIDATFNLYVFNEIIGNKQVVGNVENFNKLTLIPNNFTLETTLLTADGLIDKELSRGRLYLLEEVQASDGYVLPDVKILVYMDEDQQAHIRFGQVLDENNIVLLDKDFVSEALSIHSNGIKGNSVIGLMFGNFKEDMPPNPPVGQYEVPPTLPPIQNVDVPSQDDTYHLRELDTSMPKSGNEFLVKGLLVILIGTGILVTRKIFESK